MIAQDLARALAEARGALEAHDLLRAAPLVEAAARACAAARDRHERVDAAAMGALRALHQECLRGAESARAQLAAALASAGNARRALSAYRR